MAWRLLAILAITCPVPSCKETEGDERYIHQRIPIVIEAGKPITIEISPSGNGHNVVGLRCSLETWKALSHDPKKIVVRLKDEKKPDEKRIEIKSVSLESGGSLWGIKSFNYLFQIYGNRYRKAVVEITFPNGPPGASKAEIIVEKTPIDTKPFGFLGGL